MSDLDIICVEQKITNFRVFFFVQWWSKNKSNQVATENTDRIFLSYTMMNEVSGIHGPTLIMGELEAKRWIFSFTYVGSCCYGYYTVM